MIGRLLGIVSSLAVSVMIPCLASAQSGPVLNQSAAVNAIQAQIAAEAYWTPERMASAIPMPLGGIHGFRRESSKARKDTPTDITRPPTGTPILVPGWRPGSGPQPSPNTHIEIAPGMAVGSLKTDT